MTAPHLIRLERERDAKLCREISDRAETSPTIGNIEEAENVTRWFEKKHKCGWRKYAKQGMEL